MLIRSKTVGRGRAVAHHLQIRVDSFGSRRSVPGCLAAVGSDSATPQSRTDIFVVAALANALHARPGTFGCFVGCEAHLPNQYIARIHIMHV